MLEIIEMLDSIIAIVNFVLLLVLIIPKYKRRKLSRYVDNLPHEIYFRECEIDDMQRIKSVCSSYGLRVVYDDKKRKFRVDGEF